MATSFLDTREPLEILLLIFSRRQVIAEAVPAFWFARHSEVNQDILPCFFPFVVCLAFDSLTLQELKEAREERYRGSSAATHALLQIVLARKIAPVVTTELTALIECTITVFLGYRR